jgi:hypothetical protein
MRSAGLCHRATAISSSIIFMPAPKGDWLLRIE